MNISYKPEIFLYKVWLHKKKKILFIKDGYAKLGATVEQAAKWNGLA